MSNIWHNSYLNFSYLIAFKNVNFVCMCTGLISILLLLKPHYLVSIYNVVVTLRDHFSIKCFQKRFNGLQKVNIAEIRLNALFIINKSTVCCMNRGQAHCTQRQAFNTQQKISRLLHYSQSLHYSRSKFQVKLVTCKYLSATHPDYMILTKILNFQVSVPIL